VCAPLLWAQATEYEALWPQKALERGDGEGHLRFSLYKHNGDDTGNTLLAIGGVHGDEPGSYFAAGILASHYRITKGNLWVVPNLNHESIVHNRRGVFGDMNRKFNYVAPDDPDHDVVMMIKSVILEPEVDLVLNMHDGHGFYRDRWENYIFNPRAWGQSYVIDQKTLNGVKFGNMDEIARGVGERLNDYLAENHHYFNVKNTQTRDLDEEMQQSLTWFAVTHLKPAFGIETSKNIDALAIKVAYHLRSVEAFMETMGIEYERSFDLTFDSVQQVLEEYGRVYINNQITLDLIDLRRRLHYVPMARTGNHITFDNPLGAAKWMGDRYHIYVGNHHVSTLYPQYFGIDCDVKSVRFVADGQAQDVAMGETLKVKKEFLVVPTPGVRVNVIGFVTSDRGSQDGITVRRGEIMKRFSQDVRARTFRVEFYRNEDFCGMVNVQFL
jgi:hypothetical protein